jgi:hypothetical protein
MCFCLPGGWSRFFLSLSLSEFSVNKQHYSSDKASEGKINIKHEICFSSAADADEKRGKRQRQPAKMRTNHIKDNGNKYVYLINSLELEWVEG